MSFALNVVRACLLSALVLLAFFVVLCLALAVQAAPAPKAVRPAVRHNRPVIKLGQPYIAEIKHKAAGKK